ncbi:UDP-N-acetylglucosamine transferase subunit ALG14 homolog [Rhopalosiphum maidis]|uniref:UDP-N-acetylglucosamine transferase subunit ALG14 homolog n=1 Tax=Rhopalosiphum maidis TaxID=43146 RepID=UPI000EFDC646|nr:UDP-N-acetylglucosamine transferase subunit ALG14 homolog [Rhopalosiphum maidis]
MLLFIMWLLIPTIFSAYFSGRLMYMILKNLTNTQSLKKSKQPVRTLVVIGSGGHTAEMLRLMNSMNKLKFMPRLYLLADTDTTSRNCVENDESGLEWSIATIPRSRHVNQSYLTSIFSTIYAIFITVPMVLSFKPDLVLCNGPGTCVPVCLVAFIMKLFHYADTSIIFVESICRVKSLSLTGKLMYFIADLIIVQWPELRQKYGQRVKYLDEGLNL